MRTTNRTTDESGIFKQRLLTLPEAARYLGCTLWSVRDLIWKGQLPYTRFGKRFQVDVQDLDEMIDREKRREGTDYLGPGPTQSAAQFVVPSSATGDRNDGHNHQKEGSGTKPRKPRRGLDIQAEISDP